MPVTYPDYSMRTRVLAASAVSIAHTGTTDETVLATVAIPAGIMGLNGRLRVTSLWSWTSSANTKTARCRFSGLSGSQVNAGAGTTTASIQLFNLIRNVNAANSQKFFNGTITPFNVPNAAAISTSAVDTSADQTVVFTAQLTNTGETITLQDYMVELISVP